MDNTKENHSKVVRIRCQQVISILKKEPSILTQWYLPDRESRFLTFDGKTIVSTFLIKMDDFSVSSITVI